MFYYGMTTYKLLALVLAVTLSGTAFAEYKPVKLSADQNSVYFKQELVNVDGIIYTTLYKNLSHPKAIQAGSTITYSSEASTLRLRCKDHYISMVDGQKFSGQSMKGKVVAYENAQPEEIIDWSPIDGSEVSHEPYTSMIKACQ